MYNEEEKLMKFMEIIQENKTNQNEEIINKLNEIFKDNKIYISLALKALSLKTFNNKEISLESYINILIYLKNSLNKNKNVKSDEIISYIEQICEIIFNYNKNNQNFSDTRLFNEIENILKTLLGYSNILLYNNFINRIFKIILDNINSVDKNKNIFLQFS